MIWWCQNIYQNLINEDQKYTNPIAYTIWDHPLSTYAEFSEKRYAHVRTVCVSGLEILVFWNVLRTYLIDGSFIQQE